MVVPHTNNTPIFNDYNHNHFDENWLPGISFKDKDEIMALNNDCSSSKKKTMVPRKATPRRQHRAPMASHVQTRVVGHYRRISPSELEVMVGTAKDLQQQEEEVEDAIPKQRHVHFACHEFLETSHAPPIIPELTRERIQELWWQNSDLLLMKRYARSLMTPPQTPPSAEEEPDLLGLDRFTVERIACKKRANRLILLAQHQQRTHAISDNSEEFIRAVSRRCSCWSRSIAHAIAQRLFEEVYGTKATTLPANGDLATTATSNTCARAIPIEKQEDVRLLPIEDSTNKRKHLELEQASDMPDCCIVDPPETSRHVHARIF